jgi:hypothetical protein
VAAEYPRTNDSARDAASWDTRSGDPTPTTGHMRDHVSHPGGDGTSTTPTPPRGFAERRAGHGGQAARDVHGDDDHPARPRGGRPRANRDLQRRSCPNAPTGAGRRRPGPASSPRPVARRPVPRATGLRHHARLTGLRGDAALQPPGQPRQRTQRGVHVHGLRLRTGRGRPPCGSAATARTSTSASGRPTCGSAAHTAC